MDHLDSYQKFGQWAKVMLELHREKPDEISPEKVVELLQEKYEELGLKPVEDE